MRKDLAQQLKEEAEKLAQKFSESSRKRQPVNPESYRVKKIEPTSEHTADIIMQKNTGKLAYVFFYYVNGYNNWVGFFPTDSHLLGMKRAWLAKDKVEKHNFSFNFDYSPAGNHSPDSVKRTNTSSFSQTQPAGHPITTYEDVLDYDDI